MRGGCGSTKTSFFSSEVSVTPERANKVFNIDMIAVWARSLQVAVEGSGYQEGQAQLTKNHLMWRSPWILRPTIFLWLSTPVSPLDGAQGLQAGRRTPCHPSASGPAAGPPPGFPASFYSPSNPVTAGQQRPPPLPARRSRPGSSFTELGGSAGDQGSFRTDKHLAHLKMSLVPGLHPRRSLPPGVRVGRGGISPTVWHDAWNGDRDFA